MKNLGIYVHIPFCKRKCDYCDFVSFANKDNLIEDYIKAIKNEIIQFSYDKIGKLKRDSKNENIKKEEYKINTIYFGGGTPSYISSNNILEILNLLKQKFNISENAEITIEANPGTVNKEKLEMYLKNGINRISFGLQSIDDKLLKQIGRIHNFSEFLDSYKLASKTGFKNINIDLIIGMPTQNLQDIENTIKKIVELYPQHISVYSLILEEGTPLAEKVRKNEIHLPSDILERKMYWKVKKELEKARIHPLRNIKFCKTRI